MGGGLLGLLLLKRVCLHGIRLERSLLSMVRSMLFIKMRSGAEKLVYHH